MAPPRCQDQPRGRRTRDGVQLSRLTGPSNPGQVTVTLDQTAFFSVGEALKRTVLPAFTLIDSPVRGLRPLRALVLRTMKVPKLGRVKRPLFFNSRTTACMRSPAARFAATPVVSADSWITWARNAFDIRNLFN